MCQLAVCCISGGVPVGKLEAAGYPEWVAVGGASLIRVLRALLLSQVRWRRIVLDEAHCIKDRACNTAKAVFALSSKYKWALSGTPLQVNDASNAGRLNGVD
jgi:hypothetical protein